jgi:phosphoribosylamine-glycine ligase
MSHYIQLLVRQNGAQLEGKEFAKRILIKHNIPTALMIVLQLKP